MTLILCIVHFLRTINSFLLLVQKMLWFRGNYRRLLNKIRMRWVEKGLLLHLQGVRVMEQRTWFKGMHLGCLGVFINRKLKNQKLMLVILLSHRTNLIFWYWTKKTKEETMTILRACLRWTKQCLKDTKVKQNWKKKVWNYLIQQLPMKNLKIQMAKIWMD